MLLYNVDGNPYWGHPLGWNENLYPVMLEQIQAMQGEPISFEAAVHMFFEDIFEAYEMEGNEFSDLADIGLARWISSKGYRIVLTGNEYHITP